MSAAYTLPLLYRVFGIPAVPPVIVAFGKDGQLSGLPKHGGQQLDPLLKLVAGVRGPPSVPASTPVGRSLGPGTEHGPGIRQTVPSASCDLLLFFQPGPAKAADPSAAPLPDSVPMVLLPAAQSAQAACPLLLAVLQRGTQPPVWGICRGPLLLISRSGSLWSKETAALEKFF